MYSDPSCVRTQAVRVRFNHSELRLVDALAEYAREERAALIREIVMEAARRVAAQAQDTRKTA